MLVVTIRLCVFLLLLSPTSSSLLHLYPSVMAHGALMKERECGVREEEWGVHGLYFT